MFSTLCPPSSSDELSSDHIESFDREEIEDIINSDIPPMNRNFFGYSTYNVVRQTLSALPTPCHHSASHTRATTLRIERLWCVGIGYDIHSRAMPPSEYAPSEGRHSFENTFVDPPFSCLQSSLHKPRFQRPENSHPTQVHIFCEQYASQEHECTTLATSNSSTAAIPEPTNSCCITPVKVHLVLPFPPPGLQFLFPPMHRLLYCAQERCESLHRSASPQLGGHGSQFSAIVVGHSQPMPTRRCLALPGLCSSPPPSSCHPSFPPGSPRLSLGVKNHRIQFSRFCAGYPCVFFFSTHVV